MPCQCVFATTRQHLSGHDADPQPGEQAGAETDHDQGDLPEVSLGARQTVADQRHQLLGVGHPVVDRRGGQHLPAAGQSDIDHSGGVQCQHQRLVRRSGPWVSHGRGQLRSTACQRGPMGRIMTTRPPCSPSVVHEVELEPAGRQMLGDVLAPLDHGDRLVQGGVEIEIVQLLGSAEPIGVDMHQLGAAGRRRMDPGQHEGRRDDRAHRSQSGPDALGQRGLAGAEIAGGDDQVARSEKTGQPLAEPSHVARRGHGDRQRQRLGQDHPVRRGPVDGEAAVPPERHQFGELGPGEELDPPMAEAGGELLGGADHRRGDAVSLEVGMDRDPLKGDRAGRVRQHQDDSGRPVADLGEDARAPAQRGGHRRRRLRARGGGRIERRPGPEGGMDDLDHPGGVLLRCHRDDQIDDRDAHRPYTLLVGGQGVVPPRSHSVVSAAHRAAARDSRRAGPRDRSRRLRPVPGRRSAPDRRAGAGAIRR